MSVSRLVLALGLAVAVAGCSKGTPAQRVPAKVVKAESAKITIGAPESAVPAKPAQPEAAPPADKPAEPAEK